MDIYLIFLVVCCFVILILSYMYLKTLQEKNDLKVHYGVLRVRYEDEKKSAKEKLELLSNAKDELSKEFNFLASKIFDEKTQKFDNAHREQFESLLRPFREQITNFSTQSRDQFNTDSKDRYLLRDELQRLQEMNKKLSQDALNLTNALKGDNKVQGTWGEIVLQKILEESGLREGMEYETQITLKSTDNKTYRPDVIIHMPQDRDIIIDSKVSLVAYERFMNSDEPIEKELALKEHLYSISNHIKSLSSKNYEKLQGINTLDYILLFMPIEGAFLLALEANGEFFKDAFENNILVVSPSTLLVTLRTIEHIWRTQKQQDHALIIANEAEGMYDKLVLFVDELEKIGFALDKAQESYSLSMKRLKTGKGNIIKRAQNIVELGIKPKKTLNLKSEEI